MHLTGQYTSFDKGGPLDLIFLVSPFVIWFLGLQSFKKLKKNKVSFKQLVAEGVRISVVFGLISPFIFMTYYLLFNMAILDYVSKSYGLEGSSTTLVITIDMVVQFIGAILMGTIYSAVLAIFMRSRKVKS